MTDITSEEIERVVLFEFPEDVIGKTINGVAITEVYQDEDNWIIVFENGSNVSISTVGGPTLEDRKQASI